MKYISAQTWYTMRRRRGENPPITNVRAKNWSITIPLKDGNMLETLQDILLKLAEDPAFKGYYKEADGRLQAAISWSKEKTGQWVMNQLEETTAHIEPAIDAKTLTRWVYKS